MISTRKLSDGSRFTAWPWARDISNDYGAGSNAAGKVPFEKIALPKAAIQVLHAEIEQTGFEQFNPDEPGDFTRDPDKRYKVRTYNGTITNSAGRRTVPPPDPIPPDYETQYEFLARDITDTRVSTYDLAYSATDTDEHPDGWTLTEEGERTVGAIYVYLTGPLSDAPPPNEAEDETTNGTSSKQVGTIGGEITCTLTEEVTLADLTAYCVAKLSDLKGRADDEIEPPVEGAEPDPDVPPAVTFESEIDSFQTDALSLKLASVRMVWEGSGLFPTLPGTLIFFSGIMRPGTGLTTGSWSTEVESEITGSDKYYDARGMFGDTSWWDDEWSDFAAGGSGTTVTPHDGKYPGSGLAPGTPYKLEKHRFFSLDGLKRKIVIRHSFRLPAHFEGELSESDWLYDEDTVIMTERDGFTFATDWIDVDVDPNHGSIYIQRSWVTDADGEETLEYEVSSGGDEDEGIREDSFSNLCSLSRMRDANRWGFRGFSAYIPVPPGSEPPDLPDARYKTLRISSTALKKSVREPATIPSGIGESSTGELSGSYTLAKPSELALGSLLSQGRFTRTTPGGKSPFKMAWSRGGFSDDYQVKAFTMDPNAYTGIPDIGVGPFIGNPSQRTINETSYRVSVPEPSAGSRPIRAYRMRWNRDQKSYSPLPTANTVTFSLGPPKENTVRQVSTWEDIPTPTAGTAFWTETGDDEFTCFVGD